MENMEDEGRDTYDAIAGDISLTAVLKCPSQSGEWKENYNTADRSGVVLAWLDLFQ